MIDHNKLSIYLLLFQDGPPDRELIHQKIRIFVVLWTLRQTMSIRDCTSFHTYHPLNIEWEIVWPLAHLRVENSFLLFNAYFLNYWCSWAFLYIMNICISFTRSYLLCHFDYLLRLRIFSFNQFVWVFYRLMTPIIYHECFKYFPKVSFTFKCIYDIELFIFK